MNEGELDCHVFYVLQHTPDGTHAWSTVQTWEYTEMIATAAVSKTNINTGLTTKDCRKMVYNGIYFNSPPNSESCTVQIFVIQSNICSFTHFYLDTYLYTFVIIISHARNFTYSLFHNNPNFFYRFVVSQNFKVTYFNFTHLKISSDKLIISHMHVFAILHIYNKIISP